MEKVSKKTKILIAEDVDDNFLLIQTLLKRDSFELYRAKNGKEVIDIAKDNYFDIIFMDLKMPIFSGIEASRIIRIFNPTIPIIAVTAFDFGQIKESAIEAGCNHFISKPYNLNELLEAINTFVVQVN